MAVVRNPGFALPLAWTVTRRATGEAIAPSSDPESVAPTQSSLAGLAEPELVAQCLRGTSGAFDLIVERHRRAIYQLCYRYVSNHEDASDLTQEVFLRAYRGLRSFKGHSSLSTWLYRITVNLCLTRLAARPPRSEPLEKQAPIEARAEPVSDRLLREERAGQVRAAVARLPGKQRAALILRIYHEMSHRDIARSMGSSVGSAKANVFHALRNLKRHLDEEDR